jgi:hypothetical protein
MKIENLCVARWDVYVVRIVCSICEFTFIELELHL